MRGKKLRQSGYGPPPNTPQPADDLYSGMITIVVLHTMLIGTRRHIYRHKRIHICNDFCVIINQIRPVTLVVGKDD